MSNVFAVCCRGERAYRPDNDLLGAVQSNLGELACLRGKWDEAEAHHARVRHFKASASLSVYAIVGLKDLV